MRGIWMWSRLHGLGGARLRVGDGDRGSKDHGEGAGHQVGGLAMVPGNWARRPRKGEPLRWGRAALKPAAPRPLGHRDPLPASRQQGVWGGEEEEQERPGSGGGA